MKYVKSLANVGQELESVGFKAQDLANLSQQRFRVPQSFVVLSEAFSALVLENNLKYKVEYLVSHVEPGRAHSYLNAYTGVRKAISEAKLPEGLETELKEMFESVTRENLLGKGKQAPVRIIVSTNMLTDPENNDAIIQNVNGWEEFQVALREAWSLAYHPSQLKPRLEAGVSESKLRVAIMVQVMDEPTYTVHAYSCVPQDHGNIYLQTYYGYPDLRGKVTKDYYAITRDGLDILSHDIKAQPQILEMDEKGELSLVSFSSKSKEDRLIPREVQELARLAKKAERIVQEPIKLLITARNEQHTLILANRLGIPMVDNEPEPGPEEYVDLSEPAVVPEERVPANLRLVHAGVRSARAILERKWRELHGEEPHSNLAYLAGRLNQENAFSRTIDAHALVLADQSAEGKRTLSQQQAERAMEEAAFLLEHR